MSNGSNDRPHRAIHSPDRRDLLVTSAAGLLFSCTGINPPAAAQAKETADLLLVLAVDVSGSVNQMRFEMQKRGYVEAFRNPRILQAIESGPLGRMAVTVAQWTGPTLQVQAVPWMMIRGKDSIDAFAYQIETAPRQLFSGGTSISGAIDYSAELLGRSPFAAPRHVIDVSGDGANNRGRPTTDARDDAVRAGITINGLPILEVEPDLEAFYRNNVIGGPNAFVIPAARFEEFADAVLKKLVTEIAQHWPKPIQEAQSIRSG